MAGDVDPVSEILGSLKTSREAIEKRLDKIGSKIDDLVPTVQSIHNWVEQEGKPEIAKLKETRWKRYGFYTGIAACSGYFGSLTPKLPALIQSLFHAP